MSLVETEAAIHVADKDAKKALVPMVLELSKDKVLREKLSANIVKHGRPNAAVDIANQVIALAK